MLAAGFEIETVNLAYNFCDPVTGVHINTIKGTWNGVKMHIPSHKYTAELLQGKFFEFTWRRRHAGVLWQALISIFVHLITEWN